MVYCWSCLRRTPKDKYCQFCGYQLEYRVEGKNFQLGFPEKKGGIRADLKLLLEETENVMEEVLRNLGEEVRRAEKGIERSPGFSVDVFPQLKASEDAFLYALLCSIESFGIMTGENLKMDLAAKAGNVPEVLNALKNSEISESNRKVLRSPEEVPVAGVTGEKIIFNRISPEVTNVSGVPDILKPLLLRLEGFTEKELQATVWHELTHIYIQEACEANHKKPLKAIEEAAAMAITQSESSQKIENLETYRRQGVPKSLLKSCIGAFMELIEERKLKGKSKTDFVRKRAVEAIELAQEKNIHPANAIKHESKEERRGEFIILRNLEAAENLVSEAFYQLGFIGQKRRRKWAYEINSQDLEEMERIISKEEVMELEGEIKYLENLSIEIPGIIEGLRKLLRIYEKEFELATTEERKRTRKLIEELDYETQTYQFIEDDEEEVERVLRLYMEYLDRAEAHIEQIESLVGHLHDEEKGLASEIRRNHPEVHENVEKLFNRTEDIYEASELAHKRIERARNAVEKGLEELKNL